MAVVAIAATVVYFVVFGSRVTQANFDRIQPAMTRTEVEGILGKPTRGQEIPLLNANASVWSDKQKSIVVWYQNDKEINKIITDGQVNVSGGPPGGMNLSALSSGKDPVASLGGAAGADKEEDSAAPAPAAGPNPEQQREMEEAFRDAMKTFSKNGRPTATDASTAKDGTGAGAAQPPKQKPAAQSKAKAPTQADPDQTH
jgi:hypothetical protein